MEGKILHIGRRISALRKEKNLSQKELSKGIISSTHLSNIEAGRYSPAEDILALLAERLHVDEKLLTDHDSFDQELNDALVKFKKDLVLNMTEAKKQLEYIQANFEFPICNLFLEAFYHLLLGAFYLKTNQMEKAEELKENIIDSYIDKQEVHQYNPAIQESYYYFYGFYYFVKTEYLDSLYCFNRMLKFIEDQNVKGPIYYNLGIANHRRFQISQAIHYVEKALSIYLLSHDWWRLGNTYNYLGVLYWENKQYDQAISQLAKADEIAELIDSINLKQHIYHNLGLIYKDQNQFEQAISYFKKSISLKLENDQSNVVISYRSLIDCLLHVNKVKEAKNLLDIAYLHVKTEKDKHLLNTVKASIVKLELNENEYVTLLESSLEFFERINDYTHLKEIYELLGEYYVKVKKYKLASYHYKQGLELYKRRCNGEI